MSVTLPRRYLRVCLNSDVSKSRIFLALLGIISITFLLPSAKASNATTNLSTLPPLTVPLLASGSNPSVLPGGIAIADEGNNRIVVINANGQVLWLFPQKGDLATGQTFKTPDDVFFSGDGKYIVATESEHKVVSIIDIATRKIVFEYGVPGQGSGRNGYLNNPDDAMLLKDGRLMVADIMNCRILFINTKTRKHTQFGKTGVCIHKSGATYSSPNGVFPMVDGKFLVTEIGGDWIDAIDLTGKVFWKTHAPGVSYPSDTNEVSPNIYLTVDFVKPGQIVEFNSKGKLLWRYKPTGKLTLNHPSLAHALPNGDVIATDDANNRIIVVDPKTNKIVWQYGHKGLSGTKAGYLNNPDGLDFLPPNSLMMMAKA